jgi:hypothetical protein
LGVPSIAELDDAIETVTATISQIPKLEGFIRAIGTTVYPDLLREDDETLTQLRMKSLIPDLRNLVRKAKEY